MEYSELYEQALRLAAILHRSQNRKGSDLPYITHPVHVSVILLRHGFSTEVAVAGLLHDVVEDQGYELARIEEKFGARVAEIVAALSERKEDAQGAKRSWEVRKREALEHMRRASLEAVAAKVADTLHNVHCFALDLHRDGPQIWQHFSRGPEPQLDYYRQVLQVARERLGQCPVGATAACGGPRHRTAAPTGNHPLVDELADAIENLARTIAETSAGIVR